MQTRRLACSAPALPVLAHRCWFEHASLLRSRGQRLPLQEPAQRYEPGNLYNPRPRCCAMRLLTVLRPWATEPGGRFPMPYESQETTSELGPLDRARPGALGASGCIGEQDTAPTPLVATTDLLARYWASRADPSLQ
jgi:hypothetical protein